MTMFTLSEYARFLTGPGFPRIRRDDNMLSQDGEHPMFTCNCADCVSYASAVFMRYVTYGHYRTLPCWFVDSLRQNLRYRVGWIARSNQPDSDPPLTGVPTAKWALVPFDWSGSADRPENRSVDG